MRKYIAEAFGTFVLVLFGCGCVVVAGNVENILAMALALGISIIFVYPLIKNISGCQLNPVITFTMLLDKKIKMKQFWGYLLFQVIGGVIAALILVLILSQCEGLSVSKLDNACNSYGIQGLSTLTLTGVFIVEVVLTCLFVLVYLKFSDNKKATPYLGFIIAAAFIFVNYIAFPIDGGAANPAKTFSAAVIFGPFSGDPSLIAQMFFFIIGSLLGTLAAVWLYRFFVVNPNRVEDNKEKVSTPSHANNLNSNKQ